jgi:hypothetical protein
MPVLNVPAMHPPSQDPGPFAPPLQLGLTWPAGHNSQAKHDICWGNGWYFVRWHAVHIKAARAAEYFPAGHDKQRSELSEDLSLEKVPAAHDGMHKFWTRV